jgi:arsenate reductase-like glutaredoxin family protein
MNNNHYYSKYLKYKIKYLELKGGKLEYGLYGLFSYFGDNLNLRERKKINEKNYIHDLPLELDENNDNLIIRHLLSHCTNIDSKIEYYSGIKSFQFVPYKEDDPDKEEIQKIIDTTYFTELFRDRVPKWTELNKIKKYRNLGITTDLSEEIQNMYASKAQKILDNKTYIKIPLSLDMINNRFDSLYLESKRTCKELYKYPNKALDSLLYENILFEDELIKDKQLLLSNVPTGIKYKTNPLIYVDPFPLVNERLSYLSYSLIINKTTLSCLVKYHDVLFPIRIVLTEKPSNLFSDNIFEKKEKYQNYKGFFIIRFINDDDKTTLYSKPHNSKEQYYIFFIFKSKTSKTFDNPLYKYILTNFRNNIITWGTVIEKKTMLYYEIIQLICLYRNKNCYFYILIKKDQKTEFHNNEELINWFHPDDLQYINLFNNEIHILVSKHNINKISEQLTSNNPFEYPNTTIKYIIHDNFLLFNCHFAWYAINDKDTFCLKLGDIKEDLLPYYNMCIEHMESEIFKRDIDIYTKPLGELNKTDLDDVSDYIVLQ